MPPSRIPHDPFTAPSTTHGLRTQPSQSSLRSNASAASTTSRPRQQRDNLFAPTLSRRPTSRTRALDDDILADSSSEQERRRHVRGRGSPAAGRHKKQLAEEQDIVKRDAQGNYLLDGIELGGVGKAKPVVSTQEEDDEERVREVNAYYSALARKYFTSGAGVTTRRVDEDYERDRPEMMYCLKAEVIQKLDSERWLFEPVDRLQPG